MTCIPHNIEVRYWLQFAHLGQYPDYSVLTRGGCRFVYELARARGKEASPPQLGNLLKRLLQWEQGRGARRCLALFFSALDDVRHWEKRLDKQQSVNTSQRGGRWRKKSSTRDGTVPRMGRARSVDVPRCACGLIMEGQTQRIAVCALPPGGQLSSG